MTSPGTGSSGPAGTDQTGAPATPGSALPTSAPSAPGALPGDTIAALQAALAAEHAALWAYGLVAAHDQQDLATISSMLDSHQVIRDSTANMVVQGGATPVGPAPAYTTPEPVTDLKTARALALTIESDCAAAWRTVIGTTDDSSLRGLALSSLTDAAMRMVTWRTVSKDPKVTVPFPGQQNQ